MLFKFSTGLLPKGIKCEQVYDGQKRAQTNHETKKEKQVLPIKIKEDEVDEKKERSHRTRKKKSNGRR